MGLSEATAIVKSGTPRLLDMEMTEFSVAEQYKRLYGIRPMRGLKDVEEVAVRPLWARLMSLSADAGEGAEGIDRRAQRALSHGARAERVEI